MKEKIRILHLEDNTNDAALIKSMLQSGGMECDILQTDKAEDFTNALENENFDLIISDFTLPSFRGSEALEITNKIKPDIPFIFVSGTIGEEVAVESLHKGATDYILKDNLTRLLPAVRRALKEAEEQRKRKDVEIALFESEKKFRELFDYAPVGYHETDVDGRIVEVNQTELELLGYCLKEMLGYYIWEFVVAPESVRKSFFDQLKLKLPHSRGMERLYKRKDGSLFYALTEDRVLFDRNDKAVGIRSTLQDITQRKQAEEALRESEELFRRSFNHAAIGMALVSWKGKYLKVNESLCKIIGYKNSELLNKTCQDITHPDDLEIDLQHVSRLLDNKADHYQMEKRYIHKNGQIVWTRLSVALIKDPRNNPLYFISHIEDITHRKQVEEDIKQSEEKYRNLIEQSNDAIYLLYENKFELINKTFTEMFGYTLEETNSPDFNFINLVSPKSIPLIQERVRRAEKGEKLESIYEFTALDRSGKEIECETSINYLDFKKGKAVQGIIRDITERKQAERELIKAKEHAEISDKLKSEFLAQMSHEIRTPISSIVNFSSLIKEEVFDKLDEDLKNSFDMIGSASKRIIRTIDLILNMSEIQTGSYQYSPKVVDLIDDILDPLYQEFKPSAHQKNLSLELIDVTDNSKIFADEYSVQQIFCNLIDNAINYTHKGGIIIKVILDKENRIHIDVSDTGVGISKEYLPNLFKPFSQEDQGYTRKYEGNGLGLALVKKYCDMNNAEIIVNTEKGRGSSFNIVFPSEVK